jgi:hypothetical protein
MTHEIRATNSEAITLHIAPNNHFLAVWWVENINHDWKYKVQIVYDTNEKKWEPDYTGCPDDMPRVTKLEEKIINAKLVEFHKMPF